MGGLHIVLLWIWTSPVAYYFENNRDLRKGPPVSLPAKGGWGLQMWMSFIFPAS